MSACRDFALDPPRALGRPGARALLRCQDEDFQVEELLGFDPEGQGEHLYLHLEKRGQNTQWLAARLADCAGIPRRHLGYAGLKDRHALTRQWFSLWLPGRELDLDVLEEIPGVRLLRAVRHRRKLQRGGHQANAFRLRLRQLEGAEEALERLAVIRDQGVPNYFGEQRFGHQGQNLQEAAALLLEGRAVRHRERRGRLLSAARSQLFNEVLAERVRRACWNTYLEGDRLMPAGTTELLSLEASARRAAEVERVRLHPSAPLWGRGRPLVAGAALALETAILAPFADWCAGLEGLGLNSERRALRLLPEALSWHQPRPDQLELSFRLPPGAFATSVLRECCDYRDVQRSAQQGTHETSALQR